MRDLPGGPGWVLDGVTLLPRIVDLTEFRRGTRDDPLGDVLEALWSGQARQALALLDRADETLRVRALRADCRRELGDLDGARADYAALVAECAGTPWEAVMRQHLGKVLFASHRYAEAAEEFARALALREADGAAEPLVASSRHALEAARRAQRARLRPAAPTADDQPPA